MRVDVVASGVGDVDVARMAQGGDGRVAEGGQGAGQSAGPGLMDILMDGDNADMVGAVFDGLPMVTDGRPRRERGSQISENRPRSSSRADEPASVSPSCSQSTAAIGSVPAMTSPPGPAPVAS
ncbi:hypothetical protein [Streptosporangium roseum]|uniref:hypothetical protein n=1 Tax=Streptosporangium roseum TaxID=2001 RepID=UPI0004CDC712|nr:hypothetical protein [Streptosporangium roseum]